MLINFLYRYSLFIVPLWSASTQSMHSKEKRIDEFCIDTVDALQKEKDQLVLH